MQNTFSDKRIFVQIASYRDPQCHPTIRDLFEKAAFPERISVGVCWQYDPETDMACFAEEYPRKEQVKVVQYHVHDAQGAGWARCEAQSLWSGEEYTLQIQAHMRFEQGWDETLITMLENLPAEKAILTAWLPGYTPPDNRQQLANQFPVAVVNRIGYAGDAQMVHLIKRMIPMDEVPAQPMLTCSWVGNFMFARSSVLKDVPFDPYIYFWGEEINYSARLWTHGYDIYHLNKVVMYHYWDREDVKDAGEYRNHASRRNQLSLMRNLHILGLQAATSEDALKNIQKYTLGTARPLSAYWQFSGINLITGSIAPHAREGRWGANQKMPEGTPRIFVAIAAYRDPECTHTLADMFTKATYPDRLSVGLCLQYDPKEDAHCAVKTSREKQIRRIELNYRDSKGANWARSQAMSLHTDEDYILQIDSHMRFEPGWDEDLIKMLARCPSEKPILSTYLPNYDPPDQRAYHPDHLLRIRIRKFGTDADPQLIHITGAFVSQQEHERSGLYPCPFIAANFLFLNAKTFKEVPIDPHIHFYGDEISYAARLWTHGYDIFQPDKTLLYHYWVRKESLPQQHYRNTATAVSRRSALRVRHLLGFADTGDAKALTDIETYGLGRARSLEGLWEFAGIDWEKRDIAQDAKEGRWNMAARERAMKTKPTGKKNASKKPVTKAATSSLPRIFVQIAAYRDPDCQWTVKDLFDKAAHPERIFVGICWQYVKEEDAICFEVPYPRPDQVRVHEVDARQGKGVCWARNLTQQLWDGEEFTLQIDSHMRFEPGWDNLFIDMWQQCENKKAILTCYPEGFEPPDKVERAWVFGMCADRFSEHGILLMRGKPAFSTKQPLPEKPIAGAFASACVLFGPSSIIQDVPYDPNLYFFGEEISLAVRLWTHGYELFHPNKPVIYHDWNRGKRKTHFSDHKDWTVQNNKSYARVRHMLGVVQSVDTEITKDLNVYGLGTARTLEEYQEYSGVNFAAQTIADFAHAGMFSDKKVASNNTTEKNNSAVIGKNKHDGRIYVQIASYRDRECQWTIKDLFEKAKHPDRIQVGVCWQYDPVKDEDCFKVSTRPDQVKMLPYDWREGEGVCWARNQTQQLWDGEEYTLQIDSHMRFMAGWDELLIKELEACESDKPVLSCNPASYTPPNNLQIDPLPTIRRVQQFFPDGNIRGKGEYIDRSPEKPLNGAFIAAGFVFSRSEIIKEVPYDPYMYFDQEEITYALRLYTHGWDIFSSRKPILYHFYNADPRGSVRPLHWKDTAQVDEKRIKFLQNRGLQRFNHLVGFKWSSDPEVTRDLQRYGLGSQRSLQQYEEYCGIDFKRKIASDKALRCQFIKNLERYRDTPIVIPEIDGGMGMQKQKIIQHTNTDVAASRIKHTEKSQGLDPIARPHIVPSVKSRMLEPGDFVPFFELIDTNGIMRGMEIQGGKYCMLTFLPSKNPDYIAQFFVSLSQQLIQHKRMDLWLMFVIDDTVDNLNKLKEKLHLPMPLWADADRKVTQAFGIAEQCNTSFPPVGFVLNNNLKIIRRHVNLAPSQLAAALVNDCSTELEKIAFKNQGTRTVTETAPALIVPNVFTPEFCDHCIQVFRSGDTFQGTVGAEEKLALKKQAKLRTDYIVHRQLMEEIDDKLSRSLFPEIKKVFGFDVNYREPYKIGLYSGEDKGFFKQHRDNFDVPLGYRRIAMTLHLSDNYQGGGLRFPEYDGTVYRPERGSAIAFSCSTMHEALPVSAGERFVLVGFFHSDEDEAYRRHYLSGKGLPLKIEDYTPAIRQYPNIQMSRDFYKSWRENNISFNDSSNKKTNPIEVTMPQIISDNQSNQRVTVINGHQPKKVFESKQAIIFDDFLPPDVYEKIQDFAIKTDYEYINTKGKVARAWHVHDGFPMRSTLNGFYYSKDVADKPTGDHVYPTKTDLDLFIDNLLSVQPHVEHLTGKEGNGGWLHVSSTCWVYPHGTALSMHDDGSGVYTGAYVYFLNPIWRPHWGGLLIMMDEDANKRVYDHRAKIDQMDYYKKKFFHANGLDEMLVDQGFGKCIFPKGNRIVFIANDAYHMVTRVNEAAGDNLRMSIAGFFNRKK
ncbi:MAG: GlcNAc-transferase family protein [Alphaproteobacteria bacterium]